MSQKSFKNSVEAVPAVAAASIPPHGALGLSLTSRTYNIYQPGFFAIIVTHKSIIGVSEE